MAIKNIPRISHVSAHMGCTELDKEVSALAKKLVKEYKIDIDLRELGVKSIGYKGPHTTAAEKKKSFLAMLDSLQAGETYIFVDHPALDGPEMRAIHHIGYENVAEDRQGVTDVFTSDAVKKEIKKLGIQLVSYKEVPGR